MSIDEAINILKCDNDYNKSIGFDTSYEEQIAKWLEELKSYRASVFSGDMTQKMLKEEYCKALDDFVNFASTMPTVEQKDGTIRPMWLKEMAEQLKEKTNDK